MSQLALHALVARLAAVPATWEHQIRYRSTRRWWANLMTTPDVDVWLLSWLTEQGTTFHDHGDSRAAFAVVRGQLTEIRPRSASVTLGWGTWGTLLPVRSTTS